ncbi:MAG: hypothetical protein CFH18_00035 [Alphaproteobacteria bacterium MarineAlpha5_Bin8]|nr:MAG: hypothetical protein CFH17_00403 [Alphaproteobacteria bacterium MarineAlpha5_Bin7]PPR48419.1 MAG: hypothetical protein CFH18_00035 [Alphaproteobacteria bacterium MarineAlpha5_Bin8]PPR54416.1 MAG: hypothetical protein CFH16_00449 [Alphaproteobacteria bacterium MarineAlpha5_Bin6]|tara:strand:- start:799 stop:1212 length:414 start_codon:yes stop_codon:yes gene_type:complete
MKKWSLFIYFNIFYVIGLVGFLFLFIFEIKNIILTNFIIIVAIALLFTKLFYWYSIKKEQLSIGIENSQKTFLLRLVYCIFTYISPIYCILQEPYLVVSHYVSVITYVIVTILAIIGILIEKNLIFIRLQERDKNAI